MAPILRVRVEAVGVTRFTEEWLAQRELKNVKRIGRAQESVRTAMAWNGNSIALPWPPTGNSAVRHANGAHYIRPEVTEYRNQVAAILCQHERIRGEYVLDVDMSPPDGRRRDCDNALKVLLDAAVKCGWLEDDSMAYMKELHVYVKDDRQGRALIRATSIGKAAA